MRACRRDHLAFVPSLLLLVVSTPVAASAQLEPPHRPIRFERAAVEPFLPQSSVYVIHQDRRGFLWFGTREGLGRWDGGEMRTWKATPFAPNTLPGNLVRRLLEDRDGNLWIGAQPTDRLPYRVARLAAPDHETIHTYPFGDAVPFLDRDGNAWVADRDSLWRFEGSGFTSVAPRVKRATPNAAYMDRGGTIWVGGASNEVEQHPPDSPATAIDIPTPRSVNLDASNTSGFFEDDRGTLWVLGRGLRRLDATRTRLVAPEGMPATLDTIGTARMIQDPDGWLWLATLDGIYRFDPALTHFERYALRLPGDISTQNWALGIARDSSGAIWAGTVWGLHRYDPAADVFGFLEHDPDDPNTIGSGIVLSLHEDSTGSLWVGTLGGGLNRIDRKTGAVQRFRHESNNPNSLAHDWIWSLADAGAGRVWAGHGTGLALIDPAEPATVQEIDLGPARTDWPASILSLYAEPDGGLWMGSGARLLHRSTDGTIRTFGLPIPSDVNAILPDGRMLWLGTSAGLLHFDPHAAQFQSFHHDPGDPRSLADGVVISLFRDRAGTLWVGTNNGLDRLEPDSSFTHLEEHAGFPSSVIYAIREDDDARLWLATNRGLVRFDPGSPTSGVRVYDAATGVGNVEFNRNAGLRSRDGTLYFGGDRGVTFFHPSSLRDNTYRPPVVVTALHRSTREGTRTTRYVGDGPVVVAPDDYTVTFELAALSFTQPQRNRYAYRLEGFDAQWVNAGTNRVASYTNLPPGRYLFRARASNEDGFWNDDGVSIPVIVQPWFWETWWFRVLALGSVVATVAFATSNVQRNRHRRLFEAMRHQRALDDERARISRDMHDEVGASLTEIAILSELAVRREGGNGAKRSDLDKIAGRSRQMLDAIGEIIWTLNPEHDRPDHLASYLREFAAGFLESAELRAVLSFDASHTETPLTAEFRRNVFLILKETLANVAKHARAETVRVEFVQDDSRLKLMVLDDGIGFAGPTPAASRRNGLSNMERRAQAIGGTLTIQSVPDGGTRVQLDAPLPSGAGV